MTRKQRRARRTVRELHAFLSGAQTYEGVWFDEPHPARRGLYWWRPILRTALRESGFRV